MKNHVVLALPRRYDPASGITDNSYVLPLELLAVAGPLLAEDVDVTIVDANLEPDGVGPLLDACEGALCLGISALYGYQVHDGGRIARLARAAHERLPIVWGGAFPTTAPELLLREGVADAVVCGQGEATFRELCLALRSGDRDFGSISGLAYVADGSLRHTPARKVTQLDEFPPVPFDLIDYERYVAIDPQFRLARTLLARDERGLLSKDRINGFTFFTSWGCPRACTFCCSPEITGRTMAFLSVHRAIDQLAELKHTYGLDIVFLSDPNFLIRRSRVLDFARGLIERDLGIYWAASGEVGSVLRYSDEEWETIVRSGCISILVGAESGSQTTLRRLQKPVIVDEIEPCVARLEKFGIAPYVHFIVGLPGEPPESMEATFRMVSKVKHAHPSAAVSINPYWPLPGSGLYAEARALGHEPPQSLEEYATIFDWVLDPDHFAMPPRFRDQLVEYHARGWWMPGKVPEFVFN